MRLSFNNQFYETPIETLGISARAADLLKQLGMESIGDCLDFHERGASAMIQVPFGLLEVFASEVLPRLYEQGYLSE